MYYKVLLIVYVCYIVFFSLITLCLYASDKKRAIKGKNRIKEKTLLFFTILGGAFGAVIGSNVFRHKTDKGYFSLVIYSSFIMQLAVLFILILRFLEVIM